METAFAPSETPALALPPMPPLPTVPASPGTSAFPPGASSPPSYAPQYAPPAPPRSNPLPFIAGGAALLGVLLLVGAGRLMMARQARPTETPVRTSTEKDAAPLTGTPWSASPPASAPISTPTAKETFPSAAPETSEAPADQASLQSAILLADDAETEALRTLNPAPLYQAYTGEALRVELKKVRDYKAQGIYADAHLDNQKILSVKVSPDGAKAVVRVVETWSQTVHAITTKRKAKMPTQRVPQTISLLRGKAGWLIYADIQQ